MRKIKLKELTVREKVPQDLLAMNQVLQLMVRVKKYLYESMVEEVRDVEPGSLGFKRVILIELLMRGFF